MKRLVLAVVVTATVALLTGCGSAPSASTSPSSTSAPSSTASASSGPTGPAFDPCDGLDVGAVGKAFGSRLQLDTGTAKVPVCGLQPVGTTGPRLKYTISYLWFAAGLDQAWKTVKAPEGEVTEPPIAHADATRLVTYRTAKAYAVTAFVQTGKLIEEINGVALAPYRAARVHAATTALMAELAAKAPRS